MECLECGYDLRGLNEQESFTCPECGRATSRTELRVEAYARRQWKPLLLWPLAAPLVLTVGMYLGAGRLAAGCVFFWVWASWSGSAVNGLRIRSKLAVTLISFLGMGLLALVWTWFGVMLAALLVYR